jgi:hypothetical protein
MYDGKPSTTKIRPLDVVAAKWFPQGETCTTTIKDFFKAKGEHGGFTYGLRNALEDDRFRQGVVP